MRRNWGDGAAIVALFLLKLLTEAPVGDDDDDDEGETDIIAGLVYYFSSRLFREQAAYNTPRGWSDESSTLLNVAAPAGFSVLTQLWSIASGAVGLSLLQKIIQNTSINLVRKVYMRKVMQSGKGNFGECFHT